MREIKFRAWDKEYKSIFPVTGCWFEEQGNYHETDLQKVAGNIILMQFTGLKDKNGKEIYEGDIVFNGFYKTEIRWDDKEARFIDTDDSISPIDNLISYHCEERFEIIGNIYENPELLNRHC